MRTQMLELFSGEGKVSQVFKAAGVSTVSYDINRARPGSRAMDFLSEGGFAPDPQLDNALGASLPQVGHDLRLAGRPELLECPGAGLWLLVECQSRNFFENQSQSFGSARAKFRLPRQWNDLQVGWICLFNCDG